MIQAMAKQIVIFFIAESFDIKNFTTVLKDFKAKEKLNTWNKNGMTGLRSLHPDVDQLNISPAGFPFIDLKLTETFYQRQ